MNVKTRPLCTIEGCERPNKSHGMCSKHWDRYRAHGDVNYNEPEYRYHHGYERRGDDECWLWLKGLTSCGYGKFKAEGKTWVASRYGWTIQFAPIPEGMQVCHTCDVPRCQNPGHWFLGTPLDNMKDKVKKGRLVRNPNRDPVTGRFTTS